MCKFLVVVDGSAQSRIALDQAIRHAEGHPGAEIILVNIRPSPWPWEAYRTDQRTLEHVSRRIVERAERTVEAASIRARTYMLVGEAPELVATIAREEACDHIFIPHATGGRISTLLFGLFGVGGSRALEGIIRRSSATVTVIPEGPEGNDTRGSA